MCAAGNGVAVRRESTLCCSARWELTAEKEGEIRNIGLSLSQPQSSTFILVETRSHSRSLPPRDLFKFTLPRMREKGRWWSGQWRKRKKSRNG